MGITYVVVRHLEFPPWFPFMKLSPVHRMVTFFIALLLFCFSISNPATRICVSIMSVLVAILIIWCIRTAWESTEGKDVWRDSLTVLWRTYSNLFKSVKNLNPFCTPRVGLQDDHITLTDRVERRV